MTTCTSSRNPFDRSCFMPRTGLRDDNILGSPANYIDVHALLDGLHIPLTFRLGKVTQQVESDKGWVLGTAFPPKLPGRDQPAQSRGIRNRGSGLLTLNFLPNHVKECTCQGQHDGAEKNPEQPKDFHPSEHSKQQKQGVDLESALHDQRTHQVVGASYDEDAPQQK